MLLKEQQEVAAKRAAHGGGAGAGGEGDGEGTGGEGDGGEGAGSARAGARSGGSTSTAEARRGGQDRNGRGAKDGGKDQTTGSSRGSDREGARVVTTAPEGVAATPDDPSRVPADVGDGRDDDVVARQLREAAMSEEDPKIREKLWEEYRRYKRGES
jgi:hypothetical protein